jgi:hypothetical protein
MSDRLQQLLRQRALLQEHLAWLDREIAEASGGAPTPAPAATPSPAPIAAPIAPKPATPTYVASQAAQILAAAAAAKPAPAPAAEVSPEIAAVADEIIQKYQSGPDAMKTDIRKGCFLYFFGALVLFALGVVGLYLALRHT